jgi:hypothetical protein
MRPEAGQSGGMGAVIAVVLEEEGEKVSGRVELRKRARGGFYLMLPAMV